MRLAVASTLVLMACSALPGQAQRALQLRWELRGDVIPEVEMPGHARAAIKAMGARFCHLSAAGDAAAAGQYLLSDAGERSVSRSARDFHDNVMNPAQPGCDR